MEFLGTRVNKLILAALACGLSNGVVEAQIASDQQGQQQDQQPGQQQGEQSGQQSTQPAPVPSSTVVTTRVPLRPAPPRPVEVVPTAPSPLGKVPATSNSVTPPSVVNERMRNAVRSARQAPARDMRPRVVIYGEHSPNKGLVEIISPGVDGADSVVLVPDDTTVCGAPPPRNILNPAAGLAHAMDPDVIRCRRNWERYAADIAAIGWRRQGPDRVGGFLSDLPRENHMWFGEIRWEQFMRRPHTLVTKKGGVATRTLLGQLTVSNPDIDMDHDGHADVKYGGADCDDSDPNRFPGNPEVPDFGGHDEDCDPNTIGTMDRDNDGFTDVRVFNAPALPGGPEVRGEDCDDTRRGVNPGVPEISGNGLDDNCDGDVDSDRSWPTRPSG